MCYAACDTALRTRQCQRASAHAMVETASLAVQTPPRVQQQQQLLEQRAIKCRKESDLWHEGINERPLWRDAAALYQAKQEPAQHIRVRAR